MPRGGRYRSVRVGGWSELTFQQLTPNGKLVLLALSTGSQSNLAGVNFFYVEALQRETGLTSQTIEAALGELEKKPTPARSFVVRDAGVIWIRDQLRSDPAREGDPEIKNEKHRIAIESILAGLPADSIAVKKFRESYGFRLHTLSRRPSRGPSHGRPITPPGGVGDSPESGHRTPESGLGTEGVSAGPPCRPGGPAAQREELEISEEEAKRNREEFFQLTRVVAAGKAVR